MRVHAAGARDPARAGLGGGPRTTRATRRPSGTATAFLEQLRDEGLDVADAKVGDADPLAAISDECNFNEYDELIVSTLPLKLSKWLHIDLPRKAEAATGLPVTHVIGSEA